jgi:hypothetical protein
MFTNMLAWLLNILCQTFIAFDQNKIMFDKKKISYNKNLKGIKILIYVRTKP